MLFTNPFNTNPVIQTIFQRGGGIFGGLGKLILMFGAFKLLGRGAFEGTKDGIPVIGGCTGIVPGLFIVVALPGLLVSVSLFLNVWEGGASAVRDIIFYPRMMTRPKLLLICF